MPSMNYDALTVKSRSVKARRPARAPAVSSAPRACRVAVRTAAIWLGLAVLAAWPAAAFDPAARADDRQTLAPANGGPAPQPEGKPPAAGAAPEAVADETPPDYARHIEPILKKYCLGCHGPEEPEGGLALHDYQSLLKGGKRGAALVAGDSARSRLLLMLQGKLQPVMPPEGNPAPRDDEVALLRRWIDAGAAGPAGGRPDPTLLVTPHVAVRGQVRNPIHALAWSPEGKLLAAGRYGCVELLDAADRHVVRTLAGPRGIVNCVAFSADGRWLAAGGGEGGLFGEVHLWETATGRLVQRFVGHRDSVYAAVLSPDARSLLTASYDEDIKLWDVATAAETATLDGHNGAVLDLALGRDGRLLASASADRTVKLWDAATQRRLDTFGQATKEVYAVAMSPDGRRLATAGVDNRIRLYQLSASAREGTNTLLDTRFAHAAAIIKLAWSRDGKLLASTAEDRTVRLWDAATLSERLALPLQPDWCAALAFSPDGKQLALARLDGTLAVYDTSDGREVPPPAPVLTGVAPRGIARGVPTRIRLLGQHLAAIRQVKLSHPGIEARVLPAEESAPGAWIEIQAAAGVPRGAYDLTVETPGGRSGAARLYIDDLPQIEERLGTAPQPQDLPLPSTLWGTISSAGQRDVYTFAGQQGQTVVFDLAAAELGSKLVAMLALYDPQGQLLATSGGFDQQPDPLLAVRLPATGTYRIEIGDQQLGGSAEHHYRLSLGPFAFVTGAFPLTVPPGRTSTVELVGFNLPPDATVSVTAGTSGNAALALDEARYRWRGTLQVGVGQADEQFESEPNNVPEHATAMRVPGVIHGRIFPQQPQAQDSGGAADVDYFRFHAAAGETWIVETDAARRGSPLDTIVDVLDASGRPIPRLRLQATRDSYITFRGINSVINDVRVANWEEMELNQYMYLGGEVCRIFRLPQGPDSGFRFYDSNGQRRCYFDTSASDHALGEPVYIVQPLPPDAHVPPAGLPVFTLYYSNDDDALRRLGRDSRLTFTAPDDGEYLVRVRDVRSQQGSRHAYRLVVRRPQPDFAITIAGRNPTVPRASGREVVFRAERHDGFEGPIEIDILDLPPGISASSPVVIEAGHDSAQVVLHATDDAPPPPAAAEARVVARAIIDGRTVQKDVGTLGRIQLAERPKLLVRLEPQDLTIEPGTTITATLRIERHGFDQRVQFDVNNLPHGVYVDNIGLNGVLIPPGETQRQLFLTARAWVPETSRPFHAVAKAEGNQASPPITLHVRRKPQVASGTSQP
jgi:WD40 repeat protein